VLVHIAGHAITEVALQESDQRIVAGGDAVEKCHPHRARRAGFSDVRPGDLGAVIFPSRWAIDTSV
jgi:hypothetical protein